MKLFNTDLIIYLLLILYIVYNKIHSINVFSTINYMLCILCISIYLYTYICIYVCICVCICILYICKHRYMCVCVLYYILCILYVNIL